LFEKKPKLIVLLDVVENTNVGDEKNCVEVIELTTVAVTKFVLKIIVERVEKVRLVTIIEKNVFRGDINVLKKLIVLGVSIVLKYVSPIDETIEKF